MWQDKVRVLPGLGHTTRHQLRHTFASELLEAGIDRMVRMTLTGHRSPDSLNVYQHASAELMQDAVTKRSSHLTGIGATP